PRALHAEGGRAALRRLEHAHDREPHREGPVRAARVPRLTLASSGAAGTLTARRPRPRPGLGRPFFGPLFGALSPGALSWISGKPRGRSPHQGALRARVARARRGERRGGGTRRLG